MPFIGVSADYPPAGEIMFSLDCVGSIMSVRLSVRPSVRPSVCLSHFDRGCLLRSTSTLLRGPIDTGLGSNDS